MGLYLFSCQSFNVTICRALNDISFKKVQKQHFLGLCYPNHIQFWFCQQKLFSLDDMRYDLDKFKLELLDKMKNIV